MRHTAEGGRIAMDLVDLIVEKRFLGQEFLTWLWWKSEERGGSVAMPGEGDITVVFEKHMLLEYGEGESNEKCICSGLQTELQEARTGLKMGKKLEQARVITSYSIHYTKLYDYQQLLCWLTVPFVY